MATKTYTPAIIKRDHERIKKAVEIIDTLQQENSLLRKRWNKFIYGFTYGGKKIMSTLETLSLLALLVFISFGFGIYVDENFLGGNKND